MLKILNEDLHNQPLTGIVFLDFDGVITPNRSSWQVARELLKTEKQGRKHYEQFVNGNLTFTEWGKKDAQLWQGEPVSVLKSKAEELETVDGLKETVNELHELGLAVGVVSTGIFQLLEPTAEEFEMDFIAANELKTEDGYLTGEVEMKVTDVTKSEYVHEVSDQFSVPLLDTAAVGDTRHDIEKFNSVDLSIAFNPADGKVKEVAGFVVDEPTLLAILPIIRNWLESRSRGMNTGENVSFQEQNT